MICDTIPLGGKSVAQKCGTKVWRFHNKRVILKHTQIYTVPNVHIFRYSYATFFATFILHNVYRSHVHTQTCTYQLS